MSEIDPKGGCPRCGHVGCEGIKPFTNCVPNERPVIDWQAYAGRLLDEQRAKAMEAAARVWLSFRPAGYPMSDAREDVACIAENPSAAIAPSAIAAREVLRAFGILDEKGAA